VLYLAPRYPESINLGSPIMFEEVKELMASPRRADSLRIAFRTWRQKHGKKWEEMQEEAKKDPHYLDEMVGSMSIMQWALIECVPGQSLQGASARTSGDQAQT